MANEDFGYKLSVEHRMSWDYPASIRVIEKGLAKAPREAAAWLHRSQAENYLQTDRLDEAFAELEAVDVPIQGEYRKRYILTLARCYRYYGEFAKALELLQEPGLRTSEFLKVDCLLELQRPEEALAVLERIRLNSEGSRERYLVAKVDVLRVMGKYSEALDVPVAVRSEYDFLAVRLAISIAYCREKLGRDPRWWSVLALLDRSKFSKDGYTQAVLKGKLRNAKPLEPRYDIPLLAKMHQETCSGMSGYFWR